MSPVAGVRAGFVGLGQIGRPMALRLVAVPGGLTVHDLEVAAMEPLVRRGAVGVGTVAEVAQRSDVVSVMVRDDVQVRAVVGDLLAAAEPGLVIAVHSTISPQTAADLARLAEPYGVAVLDAPVSGGAGGAEQGRLAVMVGGSAEGFEVARPVLDLLGDLVVHVGAAGAGTCAKLARNLIHFVAFTAAGEAARLAEAAGIDPVVLGQVVRHSDAVTGGPGAVLWRDTAASMTDDDPWRPVFAHVAALGEKDLALAAELGDQLGVDTPLADHALSALAPALGLSTQPPSGEPG